MVMNIIENFKNKYEEVKLDLACGNNKRGEDWIGIDVSDETSADIVLDLNQYPWPFEDNSIDEIHCSHYVEHIPHKIDGYKLDGLILFMNEIHRILKPKSKVMIIAPYYSSIRAYGDPTHVRSICDWTFYYYNKSWIEANKLQHMGITADFDITYSYRISDEMSLRSEQVRNKAFLEDLNSVDDIMAELVKR